MMPLILIGGEFRSLIRNSLERFIGIKTKRKIQNKYLKIGYKLSIRVISSLIAVYIYNYNKNNNSESLLKEYVSCIVIALFFMIISMNK